MPDHSKETFSDKLSRFGSVIWVLFTHTVYIALVLAALFGFEHALKYAGLSHKLVPIPFFPQAVPLEDAFLLLDYCTIVVFYLVAFWEIAKIHGMGFDPLGSLLSRARGGDGTAR